MNIVVLFVILITIVIVGIFVFYRIKGTYGKGRKDPEENEKLPNEVFVCKYIAKIHCNTISRLDTLCGINNSITNSLEGFFPYPLMEVLKLVNCDFWRRN